MTVETQQTPGEDAQPGTGAPTPPVNQPPRLPLYRRIRTALTTPLTLPWWTAYVVLAIVPFVAVLGFRSGWGADQWGDVATWLSGFSTLAAVAVALHQTALARRAARDSAADAAVARIEADKRVEREIAAYRDRVEAQLRKSDELHQKQARADHLAAQRSELMVLWPVLDEAQLAATRVPVLALQDAVMRPGDMERYRHFLNLMVTLQQADSRARMFVYDTDVVVALADVASAFRKFLGFLQVTKDRTSGLTEKERDETWTLHLARIRSTRSALGDIASARLNDLAPEEVKRRADAWSTDATDVD